MSDFDWVEARSNCTLEHVFARLAAEVQQDMERHNDLNPGLSQCQTFGKCKDGSFYVERRGVHRVVFATEWERIRIDRWAHMGKRTPLMELQVRLDEDGECVLVGEDEKVWKLWQVRRRALEETLFGEPS